MVSRQLRRRRHHLRQSLPPQTIHWRKFWNTRPRTTSRTRPAIGATEALGTLTLRRLDEGFYFCLRHLRRRRQIQSSLSILVDAIRSINFQKIWFPCFIPAQDLAANSNVQDAFVIAVEKQARERLERLSALKKIKPVDMTKLSQQVNNHFAPFKSFRWQKKAAAWSPIFLPTWKPESPLCQRRERMKASSPLQ